MHDRTVFTVLCLVPVHLVSIFRSVSLASVCLLYIIAFIVPLYFISLHSVPGSGLSPVIAPIAGAGAHRTDLPELSRTCRTSSTSVRL